MKKNQEKIGELGHLNKNCCLVKTLNYSSAKRCQYCSLKFHHCLFFQYLIVSLLLVFFLFTLSFLIEGKISQLVAISIFILVIVYGYFFNKSTEKIIKANFAQRKVNEALRELTEKLEERVKQRTKKLEKANIKLQKLDKAKTEFLSIASHQLRTPLSAVKGYISMILEKTYGTLPEKIERYLKNINLSNNRLIKLVNDILNVSRIEAGKMEIKMEESSLEEIIDNIIRELKIEAEKKNLHLKREKSEKPLPKILVDKSKIRQVVINLIDNAIKYTKKGEIIIKTQICEPSIVEVNSGINKKFIRMQISDTGAGMTKDELVKIFKSFSRGAAGAQFYTEGSGLGLYVAKKLVKIHKGKIWAESKGKNKGSTFYIKLPIN